MSGSPVSLEAGNAVVGQRVLHRIHEDLEGDGRDVSAGESALGDVLRFSNGGSDDLRFDAVKLEDLGDGLDQFDAVPSDVINAADEGGNEGSTGARSEQGLVGREDQGDIGTDTGLCETLHRFHAFCGHRDLDDDMRVKGSEDFAFCDHAFRIIGEDFCGDWAIHDGGDLFDGGVEVFAFLGDQRRVRGDAGNKSHIIGFADGFHIKVKDTGSAIITKVTTKRKVEKAPLLYDLTTLQKEANSQHGFTAEHTLSIAQKLYEAKFITYPRTSSRYISDDVFATLPKLFKNLENHSEYGEKVKFLPGSEDYSKNSVNAAKVTDHHALLITENAAIGLFKDEKIVYDMILCRMIEAFSADCIKDITSVSAQVDHEVEFGISGSIIRQTGWRALSLKEKNNRQDKDADATDNEVKDQVIPNWQEGQHITLSGCTITEGKTKQKPLHTESTLLAAMETAGKEIEDDTMRQAMKDSGIGTPATRAAIIETLLKREYMVRQQKKLVPTEKGLALHSVVKNMAIANVEMTGKWEAELAKIERGEASADGFTHSIEGYTREITAELLGCDRLFSHKDSGCQCPKCKQGTMQFFGKVVRCSNKECGMPVFKQVAGKLLTDADITDLLTKGKTRTLNGFTSKQGKPFSAAIAFDENFNTKFVFAERKTAEKRGNVKRYKK